MGLSNPQITPTEASELRTKTDNFLEFIGNQIAKRTYSIYEKTGKIIIFIKNQSGVKTY